MAKYLYPGLANNERIYKHTFGVPVDVNQNEFKLEEKSSVEDRRVVGIWVTPPGNVAFGGKNIVTEAIFKSAHLSLQEDETTVVKRIPLTQILQCNDNGLPFYVDMNKVDMVESTIKISDKVALPRDAADTVLQFTFDFVKDKHSV